MQKTLDDDDDRERRKKQIGDDGFKGDRDPSEGESFLRMGFVKRVGLRQTQFTFFLRWVFTGLFLTSL